MIPKIFADTNIIIDFIEQRPLQITYTNQIFLSAEKNDIEVSFSESVLVNAWYITGLERQIIRLLPLINIISSNSKTFQKAFNSSFIDKEDAILYYSALENDLNYFVTRNEKDFKNHTDARLPVISPQKIVNLLKL